ncbi:ATP-binding protein [Actinoallomurus spadix]|uniref:CobQ/CobB/MinD/ParA nucleotide binding domain-containing protein n=1 Tax=Actinoallomurus spadix TaxID=79912 RepID=A0ABP3HJD7_9ACTN|nr:ATP-binding protein [Actinoallomurus spadix]MCO5990301.1 ATP-binding protein [Actinoallomurus spadix]
MKVAFVGKGGSGKTTLSSLFIRHLAAGGAPVVAVDADINQHLGVALGLSEQTAAAIPAMGAHLPEIKDHLRGANPRIPSAAAMVKTTPPGSGSRLLRPAGDDPIHARLGVPAVGATLMATGPFTEEDLGVSCYHSKTGAVELYLNHLVDGPGEYVVVDCTAGAESFASGMFTRFDLTFLVAEPTRKGVAVYRQWTDYAADYDVALKVIGNKVHTPEDVAFLREHVGDALLCCVGQSGAVRAMEQGRPFDLDDLAEDDRAALATMRAALDARPKDWPKFTRQAIEFHLKNARAWANAATGQDLAAQIDPGFTLGADAPLTATAL